MRCLVTGATGFVGRHLCDALIEAGHSVVGIARSGPTPVDLLNPSQIENALRDVKPEWVFHLAGYANAGKSFKEPAAAWNGNLTATQNLYTAIANAELRPQILFVSSGLVYGDADPGAAPFDESATLRPASPYAASKAAADLLSYQQTRSPGLDIVRVRPFNQIGPNQSAEYAAANFVRQIVAIERGEQQPKLITGDLSAERDLTDVRDMVRAYIRLLEVAKSGEVFNAGSGRTYVIRDVLQLLLKRSNAAIEAEEHPDPSRAKDTAITRADTSLIRKQTGWAPAITLEDSLNDMLNDVRSRSAK